MLLGEASVLFKCERGGVSDQPQRISGVREPGLILVLFKTFFLVFLSLSIYNNGHFTAFWLVPFFRKC